MFPRHIAVLTLGIIVACNTEDDSNPCESDPCFTGVTCTTVDENNYSCGDCPTGYDGDGINCTDTEGCSNDPCFTNVACTDVAAPGTGFTCGDCPAGYEGDGENCTDIDGCASDPCFTDVVCTDVAAPGTGYTCGDCPTGYEGDGENCTDIDGCASDPCFTNVVCTDVAAPGTGYTCDDCPTGYEGDGENCTDIDGCASTPCFAGVTCTDVAAPGNGYSCGNCPAGYEGDGETCTDIDGCLSATCFTGVACIDVPAPGLGYSCDDCPPGYQGDGENCSNLDECLGDPCLIGSVCTDVPAPGTGFSCTPCTGQNCPILRALAGSDQEIIAGTVTLLDGDAVDYNGSFSCVWTNDQDANLLTTCSATVAPAVDTIYTLTVTDFSGLTAQDAMIIRMVTIRADAGPNHNIEATETATLAASWQGASCADDSCVDCDWRLSDGTITATTCTTTVAPMATTEYFLTVTDTWANESDSDSATVFVTDQPAQLCGWDVVVMTSSYYPTGRNPNYICDGTGTARRQTANGKPAIVLSDLRVSNVKIVGHISVETSDDDDLIGFIWGWQNPKHFYLLNWKQLNQSIGSCGLGMPGIAVKKVDGSTLAPDTISFNSSYGFNATDYVYHCSMFWSTDRNNEASLGDNSIFLHSPRDVGAYGGGWADYLTYRFEFFYTPTRTKVVVYEDDLMTGTYDNPVTEFVIVDSSYPEGAFAFFSNSQAQVAFGDFVLASLDDFAADAGTDLTIPLTETATLTGGAHLAVPPILCEWSEGATLISSDCQTVVAPTADTNYTLTVTDDFGRVDTDDMTVFVAP